MPADHAILLPLLAMVALTFAAGIRMYLARVSEMKRRRIHPEKVRTRAELAGQLTDTRASDHWMNLFELPVLFYVGVLVAWAIGAGSGWILGLAWAFVATRVVHTLIQLTVNRVMWRFYAFIAGFVVLLGMWMLLAVELLSLP
ncbi:MAG: MAPEG family protein [Wenzhouxiangellaceae bacterium]|nr:MAPEG family protein [Wenzhouxiangellaceae bacterium]